MLFIAVDTDTVFNVYQLTYVCTLAQEEGRAVEGERGQLHLITDTEKGARFWFRENFNTHGDIYDLLDVEPISTERAHLDMEGYYYTGERRVAEETELGK
jgi:hypothetical protein